MPREEWVSKVGELSSNFQEIYSAIYSDKPSLVANARGTHLYDARSGWGRLWRLIYLALGCFFNAGFQQRKQQEAAQRLDTLFLETLPFIQEHANSYSRSINDLSDEYDDGGRKSERARKAIGEWCTKVMPFIELLQDPASQKKISILLQGSVSNSAGGSFFQYPIYEELNRLTELIQIETALSCPLPYAALDRIASCRKIIDEAELDLWIARVNRPESQISIGTLHKALSAFTEIRWRHHQARLPCDLSRLEWGLQERGVRLLEEIDPEHMQWVSSLRPGSKLACQGKVFELTVGRNDININGKNFTQYDIKDDDHRSLLFGCSGAAIPIAKLAMSDLEAKEKIGVRCYSLDPKGRFAIVDRIFPLKDRPWSTLPHANQPTEDDRLILDQLAKWMHWWLRQNPPPKGLCVDAVMLDSNQQLRYINRLDKAEIDAPFSAIEDFLDELTNKNEAIYRYLWQKAEFHSPRLNFDRYYRQMMQHAVQNLPAKSRTEASIYGISDPGIVVRGKEFYSSVKKLRQNCLNKILQQRQVSNYRKLEEIMNKTLLKLHKEWGEAPFIWQSDLLKNRVIQQVLLLI